MFSLYGSKVEFLKCLIFMDVEVYGPLRVFLYFTILFSDAPCLVEALVKFHKVTLLPSFCPFFGNNLFYPTCGKPCRGCMIPFTSKSGLLYLAYSSLSNNYILIQVLTSSSTQPAASGYVPAIVHMAVQWV